MIFLILGLAIGSFLNSAVYSLETGKNLFKTRSVCPHCRHELSFWDLIPLVSFVFLKGRCRYCREKISVQYPLVELSTGIVFAILSSVVSGPLLYFYLFLASLSIVIFVYDLKHYLIPDIMIYLGLVGSLIFFLFFDRSFLFWNGVLSSLSFAAFFGALHFFSGGRWMGFGDVKLAFLMGLVLGSPNLLVGFFLAVFGGSLVGSFLVLFGGRGWKSKVPFGPFLIGGMMVALVWGEWLVGAYLGIMGI